jgi:hypothetical protein
MFGQHALPGVRFSVSPTSTLQQIDRIQTTRPADRDLAGEPFTVRVVSL